MLDFLWSLLGGLTSKYFLEALLFVGGFITGALMFRNNPVTGESYAQKFLLLVSAAGMAVVNLKNKLLKKEN
ncbi:MAG TPA: hypothetical protein VMW91_09745 [Desulfosporosinus sp.]|nr:hypothetical protein [Desulfosporosinus sp.]